MPADEELEKKFAAELERLRKEEAHKKLLYDRNIGGQNVPRPSRSFVEQSVGPLKSDEQIRREAREQAMRTQRAAEIEAERRAEVERSMREHQSRIEKQQEDEKQRKEEKQKMLEKEAEKRELMARFRQAHEQGRGKDRSQDYEPD